MRTVPTRLSSGEWDCPRFLIRYTELANGFLDEFSRNRNLPAEKKDDYRAALDKFGDIISSGDVDEMRVRDFLDKENNFIIESFLWFLKTGDVKDLPERVVKNIAVFHREILRRPVKARDYDERICSQPLQFQIDSYYEPKEEDARRRIAAIMDALDPKPGELILDVGCGVGTFAYHCARKGADTRGVDYSKESIEVARRLAGRFGVSERVEFTCCDATIRLPYDSGYFDKAVAADFMEHVDDAGKTKALSEILRILKPGGILVIFTPNGLRESLGAMKSRLLRSLGSPVPETRLHYGLTNRFRFEKMLRAMNVVFTRQFLDVTRPYLAKIPFFNELLSLNILWVIKNGN